MLVASPEYIRKYGAPETPGDLADHFSLNYGHTTLLQRWHLQHKSGMINAPINSRLCSNNGDVLRDAAITGHGITKLPIFLAGDDIIAGRLQIILPDYPPTELGIYALYAPHKYLAAKTRLFIDFLVERFGPQPPWDKGLEV